MEHLVFPSLCAPTSVCMNTIFQNLVASWFWINWKGNRMKAQKTEQLCLDPAGHGQSTRAAYGSSGHRGVADPAATSRFSTLCFETSSSVQSCSLCRRRKAFNRKLVGLFLPALSQQTPVPAIVCVHQRADGPRVSGLTATQRQGVEQGLQL